jgi:hypothetical protein
MAALAADLFADAREAFGKAAILTHDLVEALGERARDAVPVARQDDVEIARTDGTHCGEQCLHRIDVRARFRGGMSSQRLCHGHGNTPVELAFPAPV